MSYPEPLVTYSIQDDKVTCMCFICNEPNSTYLLIGSLKGLVYVYDLSENRQIHSQTVSESSVMTILRYEQTKVLIQDKNSMYLFWKFQLTKVSIAFTLVSTYTGEYTLCRPVLVDPFIFLFGSTDVEVAAASVESVVLFNTYKCSSMHNLGQVMCVQVARSLQPDVTTTASTECHILVAHESGNVFLYNFKSAEITTWIQLPSCVFALDYDPESRRVVVADASNYLRILTIDNTFKLKLKCEYDLREEGCSSVKIRQMGPILVAGGWDGRVTIASWKTLITLAVLTTHSKQIVDIQFSSRSISFPWNSHVIAVGSSDGLISLWSLYNRQTAGMHN